MPTTLGSLPTDKPELRITFASKGATVAPSAEITGVVTLTPEELLENGVPAQLPDGSLILITSTASFQLRGRIISLLGRLLKHMSAKGSVALTVFAPGARQPFPRDTVNDAVRYGIALLVTSAPAETWQGVHEDIQRTRLLTAERRAAQLGSLVQELPSRLADPRATQRITDWLARTLNAQVLVREPDRVLAAAPDTAAEEFARAGLRGRVDGTTAQSTDGPHLHRVPFGPSTPTDTELAVLRETAFDGVDVRLLHHAAKLLGLVDQATREYRAASDAACAARTAALELLLEGEVAKARRVMANLAPGLLHADKARAYVIKTRPGRQDVAARRCDTAVGKHALIVRDPQGGQRILIVQPIPAGQDPSSMVAAELTRLVRALGPQASLGGSRIYAMNRLAEAMHEARTVQGDASLPPDSVALSVHDSELMALLPQPEAQQWA
ncbi:hypothetical protein [Streptomyces sp. cg35]|uniref:hypothetical protein n=1 Tax=Streptomyces sp. cg35 TaxID=3421650 RepID=UPI003D177AB2